MAKHFQIIGDDILFGHEVVGRLSTKLYASLRGEIEDVLNGKSSDAADDDYSRGFDDGVEDAEATYATKYSQRYDEGRTAGYKTAMGEVHDFVSRSIHGGKRG